MVQSNCESVQIRVPASAANLGPGYDSFGLALGRYDEVSARRTSAGLSIVVDGVGASTVPTDETHLVFEAAVAAFGAMGELVPGLEMRCVNAIPHGGGQGSSAAAVVAGVLMARALVRDGEQRLIDDDVFALATGFEGHPDNVAPALFGGFTIAWMNTDSGRPRAVCMQPHPDIRVLALTADDSYATAQARAVLPATVPHEQAAANASRAGLLVHAMTSDPALLLDATEDWLHQPYRQRVMPQAGALLNRLRADGLAAVLSGAGPSLLVLGTDVPDPATMDIPGYRAELLTVPRHGCTVDNVPFGATRRYDDVANCSR